jgi:uracil-DNA glycosylase
MSKLERPAPRGRRLALAAHCDALAGCRACSHGPDVLPIVSRAASPRVMLVGQAPGATESAGGKPFAGRAGKTLFRWLERAGIDEQTARREIYIAAITRCYPGPSPSGRGDRVPSPAEQQACARWLDAELAIIRPVLIVPVGRLAITRFLPNVPLDELIGCGHDVDVGGRSTLFVPLPHPSGASSWIHQDGHQRLLDRALDLIGRKLVALGIAGASGRSVA